MVAAREGSFTRALPATNAEASPYRFVIGAREQLALMDEIESAGEELAGIYHSHTRTAPEPSQTDINFAQAWPGVLWIIVGLSGDQVEVRTWAIEGEMVMEHELEVG